MPSELWAESIPESPDEVGSTSRPTVSVTVTTLTQGVVAAASPHATVFVRVTRRTVRVTAPLVLPTTQGVVALAQSSVTVAVTGSEVQEAGSELQRAVSEDSGRSEVPVA